MRQRSVPLNDLIIPREQRGRHIEPEGRTRVNKRDRGLWVMPQP
jgi:hypothetical protein